MKKEKYESITLYCKDCGKEFIISPEEQKYFYSMKYELPKRCRDCRKARKEKRKVFEEAEMARYYQKKSKEDERLLAALLKTLPYDNISIENLKFDCPDDSLVIIGNGFDIMHGVKSSYWDFQNTIGKNSILRHQMEIYLDVGDLWSNLEYSLGKLNYSMFLNSDVLDMNLENFDAYNPDAQAADFFGAIEMTISPAFIIPQELEIRFKRWVKKLKVESEDRPFSILHGDYKVLSFNYTEFIEELYGASSENICYIHGCRKNRKKGKQEKLILGHTPGMEEEQWDKVKLKSIKSKKLHKRNIFEAAIETSINETLWYDEKTTKNCKEIIKNHTDFFEGLSQIKEVYVIGHSLSEVDYPYFEKVCRCCNARWIIGYHSYDDLQRLVDLEKHLGLKNITIFRI